jgi:hypothetical protein
MGTLAVYKNDNRLGIVSSELAGGEYCWAATLFAAGSAVRIEKKPVPDVDESTQVIKVRRKGSKRRVGLPFEDCRAVKPKAAVDHQHTGDHARTALDSAAYTTPAAADIVARATVATVHVQQTPALLPRGPPEPPDDPTDEEVVGVPALPPEDEAVTSIPVVVDGDTYSMHLEGDDGDRGDDLLDCPQWPLPVT